MANTPVTNTPVTYTIPTYLVVGLCVLLFLMLQIIIRRNTISGNYQSTDGEWVCAIRDIPNPDGKLITFMFCSYTLKLDQLLAIVDKLTWETLINLEVVGVSTEALVEPSYYGWNLAHPLEHWNYRLERFERISNGTELGRGALKINYITGELNYAEYKKLNKIAE